MTFVKAVILLMSIIPVSYTHLDVYKRQAIDASKCSRLNTLECASYGIFKVKLPKSVQYLTPVSYTHLDLCFSTEVAVVTAKHCHDLSQIHI